MLRRRDRKNWGKDRGAGEGAKPEDLPAAGFFCHSFWGYVPPPLVFADSKRGKVCKGL